MTSPELNSFIEVPLTRGMVALVDAEDESKVSPYKWQAVPNRNGGYYASRGQRINGKEVRIFMHNEILTVPEGMFVDHRDTEKTLDNRKRNLRPSTFSQNCFNRRLRADNKSGFKGVSRHGSGWRAKVTIGGVHHTKTFERKEDAIDYAKQMREKLHGEFSRH